MTPQRWQDVKSLFDAAVDHAPAERAAFLDTICAGNGDLRRQVDELLAAHDDAGSRFDEPVLTTDPMIGRTVGAYKIMRRLGTGGMGTVYLAARSDDQFRRLAAVKVIRAELLDERTRRRFENERHTLAVLDHPNIVRLLDGGATEDGLPFLVMDYVEGQPIDGYAKQNGLSIAERLGLFRTLCEAVHYAHQNLVVHRDLKPANILVTPQGIPKLLDFGIAKLLRPEYAAGAVGFTRTVAQPMTPEYASPEQIQGQPITTASDIYALGVLLYVLLSGAHPFVGQTKSSYDLERAICEGEPGKPSDAATPEIARQLCGDLDMIVLTAMRKEPQRRYASAERLAEDVRRYLDGKPVAARGDGLPYRARKFVGRHRTAVAASAVAVGLLAYLGAKDHQDRLLAERRFEQLRSLANFVISDLDRAMRQSPTLARKTLSTKAVEHLDGLARETSNDPVLQREVADGYLRIADIQGNRFASNLGDTAAARTSAEKALGIAAVLVDRWPQDPSARALFSRCHEKLGDILEDRSAEMDHYRKAIDLAGSDVTRIANVWSKVANIQLDAGDPVAAARSLRTCDRTLRGFEGKVEGQKLLQALARTKELIANAEMEAGESASAEAAIREAIATYERAPNAHTPEARRNIAIDYKELAQVQQQAGKNDDALNAVHKAMEATEALAAEDPESVQYGIDLAQESVVLIDLLLAKGSIPEARAQTKAALDRMQAKAYAAKPNRYYLVDTVAILIAVGKRFSEFSTPKQTLELAVKAADLMKHADYETMDLLAKANELAGNRAAAVDAETKAIALLPQPLPGHPKTTVLKGLEQTLARLESRAK